MIHRIRWSSSRGADGPQAVRGAFAEELDITETIHLNQNRAECGLTPRSWWSPSERRPT